MNFLFRALLLLSCGSLSLWTSPTRAQITLHLSANCAALVDGRLDHLQSRLTQILSGAGEVAGLTSAEISLMALEPQVRTEFHTYAARPNAIHDAIFIPLAASINHHFGTQATTYIDNSTPYLRLSTDMRWIAIDQTRADDARPLHLIIFREAAPEWVLPHEKVHLEDLEALHAFAQAKVTRADQRVLIRYDVFKIVTELRAYKQTFQLHQRRDLVDDELRGVAIDILPVLQNLSEGEQEILRKSFGLHGNSYEDFRNFVTNGTHLPSLEQVMKLFDQSVLTVVAK